ncbi:MAG TPA: hypothetical protein HA302_06895, partial [Thermococcaceae archaeon]|nr:hypothetical protein [Thermococcaceae archaeon]
GDVWVLRLDAEGNLKWQKTYGGSYLDGANTVILTENGDIIVAGATASFGTGTPDYPNAWVLRLDENGNVKWQKAYGGSDLDVATAIALALNSDIIVAGITNSSGTGKDDFWVLRFPPDGLIPGFSMDSEAIIWNLAIQKSNSNATISDSEARVMDSNAIVLNSKAIITKVIELETLKTTTTTTTTETTTSTATTTTSQEQATETTEEENSDICGPATFLVFVLIGGVVTRIKGEKC